MKILLFNLGSIEKRVISFDIKGYNSLFEHDVILWGPIPNDNFSINGKEIPIIKIFEQTSITEVFNRLPKGWVPDIVTCETSVLNYIPDIYLCPAKTILFTRDSWADTIFNRKLVELFDFVPYGVIDRSLMQTYNVKILPLTGFAVSHPDDDGRIPPFSDRKIDVIAIANYDSGFYHDRYKVFFKLAASNVDKLNINFANGLKRSEIHEHYQNSKIVIDWAHTLSNRSIEAALNGCLLFSHEENVLMKKFWVPFEEFVPYNENNMMELVGYYLNHPEESKRIIDNAQQKIKKISVTYGQHTLENINIASQTHTDIQGRINRIKSLSSSDLYYRISTPFLYNYKYNTNFPSGWRELYFERINLSLANSDDPEMKIPVLIEAARLSFLTQKFDLTLKYLEELTTILPGYAWSYYLKARILLKQREIESALLLTQKSIDSAQKNPELLQKYILPVVENDNPCDGRRITDYMWQSVYGHNNEFQLPSFFHLAHELSGDIYILKEQKNEAIKAYSEAISYIAIPRCLYKVTRLLIESKKYEILLDFANRGLEDSPYDSLLLLYKSFALVKLQKKRNALKILKQHRTALKSFTGNRRLHFTGKAINAIITAITVSKLLGAKLIDRLIVFLEQRKNEL